MGAILGRTGLNVVLVDRTTASFHGRLRSVAALGSDAALSLGEGGYERVLRAVGARPEQIDVATGWRRGDAGRAGVPFTITDATGELVEPVTEFIREFSAGDASVTSCRSNAYDLLRWWR